MDTFLYGGAQYTTMDLADAAEERKRMVEAGEKDVCIISCAQYGGNINDYIVVAVKRPKEANNG